MSLKLLAEQLLLGCPQVGSLTHLRRNTLADGLEGIDLYVPGEMPLQRLTLRTNIVVYASPHNPGAKTMAQDLAAGMGGRVEVTSDSSCIKPNGDTRARATHFLLYLNDKTYLDEAREMLAEQLRFVRAEGSTVEVVMVHENDQGRGGCNFGIFFDGRTPQDLLQARATRTASSPAPTTLSSCLRAGRVVRCDRPRSPLRSLLARIRGPCREGPWRHRRRPLPKPRLRHRCSHSL